MARRPGDGRGGEREPRGVRRQGIEEVADHYDDVIGRLTKKPAVIGHSFGGLLTQIVAGRGLSAASVAVDPAPFRGVLPLPISALKSAFPVLGNPANISRAVPLTYDQFRYAFANAVSEDEAKQLFEEYAVPPPASRSSRPRRRTSTRGPRRRSTTRTPTAGRCSSSPARRTTRARGRSPTRRTSGSRENPGVTEITEIKGRGHALTIDSGWREVADTALAFVKRFVS